MFIDGHRTAHYGYANFQRGIAPAKIERGNKEPGRGVSLVAKICEEWDNNGRRARGKINFGAIRARVGTKVPRNLRLHGADLLSRITAPKCCMSCR